MRGVLAAIVLLVATTTAHAATLIAGSDRLAILEPLANEARIVDLDGRAIETIKTGETPIDAVFLGKELVVLARDARTLERGGRRVALAADPAFLREANGMLYVYSRIEGIVEEIDPARMVVTRRVNVAPFASDLELAGKTGYLVYPADGKLRTFSLTTMQAGGSIEVGAVPVDVAFATSGTALTARTLAVADPSARRVWMVEGEQSMTEAVTRGFLRGLLGLGLRSSRDSRFPTGVDRVATRGSRWVAYDSSTRTLYRFTKSSATVLATDVDDFALVGDGVALLENGRVRILR